MHSLRGDAGGPLAVSARVLPRGRGLSGLLRTERAARQNGGGVGRKQGDGRRHGDAARGDASDSSESRERAEQLEQRASCVVRAELPTNERRAASWRAGGERRPDRGSESRERREASRRHVPCRPRRGPRSSLPLSGRQPQPFQPELIPKPARPPPSSPRRESSRGGRRPGRRSHRFPFSIR